jgi:NADPH:quinone reductase-like Zn-dependent oxidoreductase
MNILRRLQLVAHGEPSDVIELSTVSQPALGRDEVLISMEAAPLNPSDFLFIRGIYGVRPAFPSPVGAEGVGRVTKTGSKVDVALQGKRVLILPTYEQVRGQTRLSPQCATSCRLVTKQIPCNSR